MNSISQHISRKRYNKVSTNVIYYINDKMSDTNMRKHKTGTELSEAGRHRDVDWETTAYKSSYS